MCKEILKSEKKFFCHKYISDRAWLCKALHEDFSECGKSGYIMTRNEVIESLLKCDADRDIVIYNFSVKRISENTAIAHYYTISDDKVIYRTSVWVYEGMWRLYFHQASTLSSGQSEKMILNEQ